MRNGVQALSLDDRAMAIVAFAALERQDGLSILRELVQPMFKGAVCARPALFPELNPEKMASEGWKELQRIFFLTRLPVRKTDVSWRIVQLSESRQANLNAWDDGLILPLTRIECRHLYHFNDGFIDKVLISIHEHYGSRRFIFLRDEFHDILEWISRLNDDMLTRPTPRPLLS